jgi:hypothetical protein
MPQFEAAPGVTVTTEHNAVVVTLPADTNIDHATARAINREYMEIIRANDITGALTILEPGASFDSPGFQQVEDAAVAGYSLGIERWAVVTDDVTAAGPFSDHVIGIETAVFETKHAALNWLATNTQPPATDSPDAHE